MNNLLDYNLEELSNVVYKLEQPKFRAAQIYNTILNGKGFADKSVLPQELKQKLKDAGYNMQAVKIIKAQKSPDKSIKFLFRLNDDNIIEGVLMQYKFGKTLCVSTQVGCRMGCAFCASGLNFSRNLTAGEILGQIVAVNNYLNGTLQKREITNIVLMGSGEPLDNFDNVVKFLKNLTSVDGFNFSVRNITLSTCGIPSKIEKLADLGININLAISLHASNNNVRRDIMAVSKSFTLDTVIEAARYYYTITNRRIIIEYALIDGVNSTPKHAKELVDVLGDLVCHVNLIYLNPVEESNLKTVDETKARLFLRELVKVGISATIRRKLGDDNNSACGQLRANHIKENSDKSLSAVVTEIKKPAITKTATSATRQKTPTPKVGYDKPRGRTNYDKPKSAYEQDKSSSKRSSSSSKSGGYKSKTSGSYNAKGKFKTAKPARKTNKKTSYISKKTYNN